jgi:hypothetical protein
LGQLTGIRRNIDSPHIKIAHPEHMNDHRVISWATFDLENPCHRKFRRGICAQAVHRLRGQNDQSASLKHCYRSINPSLVGSLDLGVGGGHLHIFAHPSTAGAIWAGQSVAGM